MRPLNMFKVCLFIEDHIGVDINFFSLNASSKFNSFVIFSDLQLKKTEKKGRDKVT